MTVLLSELKVFVSERVPPGTIVAVPDVPRLDGETWDAWFDRSMRLSGWITNIHDRETVSS